MVEYGNTASTTGRIALLFPGQGAQYVGMGKDFYDTFPTARQTFDASSDSLGTDFASLIFDGTDADLRKTENTQPAILTTSIAIRNVLLEHGFSSDFTCGLSLGEYSALVHANSISFTDAIGVVRKRGQFMNDVARGTGTMGAIVGLDDETVDSIVAEASTNGMVSVGNYNTSEQIVITGEKPAVSAALKIAKEKGARKTVPLLVGGPFHSPLLAPAGNLLEEELDRISIVEPRVRFISNVDALEKTTGEAIRAALVRQVSSPVLWYQTILALIIAGVQTFVEVGPGNTLSNFVRAIAERSETDGIRVFELQTIDSLDHVVSSVV